MYVCICHAIRDTEVREVVADGESSLRGVYAALNCKPRCGTCLAAVSEIVAEESQQADA